MALQPTRRKPPVRKPRRWTASSYPQTRELVELRGRTLAQSPDDPLATTDWWATIETDIPNDRARYNHKYVRLTRLRLHTKLPSGCWSFRVVEGQHSNTVDISFRFEGMQPGWVHASAEAKEDWSAVTWVQAEREPGLPEFDRSDYHTIGITWPAPRVYNN